MGLNIGTAELDNLMLGTQEVDAVMLGTAEVWSAAKKYLWGNTSSLNNTQNTLNRYDLDLALLESRTGLSPTWKGVPTCDDGKLYLPVTGSNTISAEKTCHVYNPEAQLYESDITYDGNSSTLMECIAALGRMYFSSNNSSLKGKLLYFDLSTGASLGQTPEIGSVLGRSYYGNDLNGGGALTGNRFGAAWRIWDEDPSGYDLVFCRYDPASNLWVSSFSLGSIGTSYRARVACTKKTALLLTYQASGSGFAVSKWDIATGTQVSAPANQVKLFNMTGGH